MKSNKEILYVSYLNNWGSGIQRKIENHCDYFVSKGYKVKYITLAKKVSKVRKYLYKILPFCSEYSYSGLQQGKDIVFIRYGKMDFQGYLALKKLRNHCKKIIVEMPTFPYDGENKGIFRVFAYKDKIWRNKIYKYVDNILTYSDDNQIYRIPAINISNFVNVNAVSVSKRSNKNLKEINLIAVASVAFWHGYDRVIEGMRRYYENDKKVDYVVFFHIVGDGKELLNYIELAKKYNLEQYIKFYGNKTGSELDQIYDLADIAIDSLGRHRNHIFYNSTLKGKEYLAKGLPIISGVKTEIDNDKDFKYYLRIAADDTPMDISNVIKFFNKIYNEDTYENVHKKIREYTEKNFCIEKCMEPIIKIMES